MVEQLFLFPDDIYATTPVPFTEKEREWLRRSDTIDKKVKRYEQNDLTLTKAQMEEMYREWKYTRATCPHLFATYYSGTYTDVGYGLDRYYPTKWLERDHCGGVLHGSPGDRDDQRVLDKGRWNGGKLIPIG